MLSGETAYGKYPMESVQTMTRIIREAEQTKLGSSDIRPSTGRDDLDITSFLAKQAVKSSLTLNVKAIVNDCFSGRTARYLSAFRGEATVFAICSDEKVMRMLSISYGVWAVFQPWNENRREYIIDALNRLLESGRIKRGDKVAHLSGSFGSDGGTTFLEINEVDKIFSAGIEYKLPAFKV
jgi:pyruvate kinase